jgi:MoaA/NifB/PqqE/SkfB family radical SAM enzyme
MRTNGVVESVVKAKVQSRYKPDRINLDRAIPMDTPLVIFLDPSSACNFRCKFCFHQNRGSSHTFMTEGVFSKCLSDLSQFPGKLKVIHFYAFGEPTLNPNFVSMLARLKSAQVSERVDFTTNGSRLNPDMNARIMGTGVNKIIISVGGLSDAKFLETCNAKINFDEYVKNIENLYNQRGDCIIHIKTTNGNVPQEYRERFFDIFGNICDEIFYENAVDIWHGAQYPSSGETGIYQNEITHNEVCPYIFYQMTVHSDGAVSSCFMDWEKLNMIGNVNETSLVDIWKGSTLHNLRINHLVGKKKGICVGCGQLKYGSPDNIDSHRAEIFHRISRDVL